MPDSSDLLELLRAVASGARTPEAAVEEIDRAATAAIPGATVDWGRQNRCGYGEVIYGEGKSQDLIAAIARKLLERQREVLVTRVEAATAEALTSLFAASHGDPEGRTLRLANEPIVPSGVERHGHVAVVTAGSTDAAVGREAAETLRWMGARVTWMEDIGVAGPQRLLAAVPQLRGVDAVVVVAGMEGALPSVVGGHVAVPVIAVPTSVGYGAALGGLTPMLGMLTSCTSNVVVVNIDAGFKAGYVAGLIAARAAKGSPRAG